MSVTFSDITEMLAVRKPINQPCIPAVTKTLQTLSEQGIALSEEWIALVQNLSILQNKSWPQIRHPRVAFYASNYGHDLAETQKRLSALAQQQDFATRLCALVNADLRVYELDLTHTIPDDGISEEEAAHALSYGLMAVEEHVDCLIVEALSSGSDTVLKKWHQAMLRETNTDALKLLQQCGAGHDLFAMMGAVFAARMANIPVFGGTKLSAVLPLALSQIMPNEQSHFIPMPSTMNCPDLVQIIAGIQQLQLILSLGVTQNPVRNLITPKAA
jgi:hypothetical protein